MVQPSDHNLAVSSLGLSYNAMLPFIMIKYNEKTTKACAILFSKRNISHIPVYIKWTFSYLNFPRPTTWHIANHEVSQANVDNESNLQSWL